MPNYSDGPPFNEKSSSDAERCSVGKPVSTAFVRWVGISKGVKKNSVGIDLVERPFLKAQTLKSVNHCNFTVWGIYLHFGGARELRCPPDRPNELKCFNIAFGAVIAVFKSPRTQILVTLRLKKDNKNEHIFCKSSS